MYRGRREAFFVYDVKSTPFFIKYIFFKSILISVVSDAFILEHLFCEFETKNISKHETYYIDTSKERATLIPAMAFLHNSRPEGKTEEKKRKQQTNTEKKKQQTNRK
eukprot:GEMP01133984.1.p1 GENE.GEMP01133984.1~~GEMP01133984.1.p1  ORF type:complete len:107 (-),score=14.16 GEMP01133984.1:5-325(-)